MHMVIIFMNQGRYQKRTKVKKASMLQAKIALVGCVLLAVVTGRLLTATQPKFISKTDNIILIKAKFPTCKMPMSG
jgi:hypothetical protein